MLQNPHHSRNPTLAADICWYTFQSHDCAGTSLLGNASLMKLSFIESETEGRFLYLLGGYNIHDHPTLERRVRRIQRSGCLGSMP